MTNTQNVYGSGKRVTWWRELLYMIPRALRRPATVPAAVECTNAGDLLIQRTEAWLRECHRWMMTNDLDMQCPMDEDPEDLADELLALRMRQTA